MNASRALVASAAVACLMLSACGDAGEELTPSPSPSATAAETASETASETTSPMPTEVPTEAPSSYEPPSPTSEFTWEEGPVELNEFVAHYGQAMRSVPHVLVTQQMDDDSGGGTTYVDNTDPANPASYQVTESGGFKIETVMRDGRIWTRADEGDWEDSGEYGAYSIDIDLLPEFREVELVDVEQRMFRTVLAEGQEGAPEPVQATLSVDEHFRAVQMNMELSGLSTTLTYDYETQMEIPQVGS